MSLYNVISLMCMQYHNCVCNEIIWRQIKYENSNALEKIYVLHLRTFVCHLRKCSETERHKEYFPSSFYEYGTRTKMQR
jgi:hypothetical protein